MTRKTKPRSMKAKAELPPYASMNTRIQHRLNTNAANTSLSVYRMGWRYMWKVAAKTMKNVVVRGHVAAGAGDTPPGPPHAPRKPTHKPRENPFRTDERRK